MTPSPSELGFVPVISVAAVRRIRHVGERFLAVQFAALVWQPTDLHDLIVARPTPHLMAAVVNSRPETHR